MNEEVLKWVIGGYGAWLLTFSGAAVIAYISATQRIQSTEIRLNTLIAIMGEKAARILHSPHTPELDALLEKYIKQEMTKEDWTKLLSMVDEIEENPSRPKEERGLAAVLGVIIRHHQFWLPPKPFKKHTE